jgi:hypothetical protein
MMRRRTRWRVEERRRIVVEGREGGEGNEK